MIMKLGTWALVGVVGYAAAGCGYSEEEMQTKRARIGELEAELHKAHTRNDQTQTKLADLKARNDAMAERLHQLGVDNEQLVTERGSLQSDLAETRRALEELRARERQAQARLATFRSMLQKFKAMIAAGQLRVRIVRGQMVVELAEKVLFDSGKAQLKRGGNETLQSVAAVLKSIPGRNFQIAGHTDNVPIRHNRKFPTNWELSTARAVTVTRFLSRAGVPSQRLSAAGYAETQPVASNDTEDGRRQNRRIEIVLMPNLDELPDLSRLEAESGGSS